MTVSCWISGSLMEEEFELMDAHFRQAAENASRDDRNLREFSENASHELQTPLAIMRSNPDLLVQEGMTERQSELVGGDAGASGKAGYDEDWSSRSMSSRRRVK